MKTSKPISLLLSVLTALLVFTGSVAVALLCRPFYYAHIGSLGLEAYTGLSQEQIRGVYDQMMDYCLGLRPDFAAGGLPFSPAGESHFADVRGLFLLDLWVLALSFGAMVVLFVYCRKRQVRPHCFGGHGPGFWAATGLGVGFLSVGALTALDFQRAFVVFHTLFFPGKDNWMFDWMEDPVILLLPEVFFRNCAVLILALLLLWCGVLLGSDLWAVSRRKKRLAQQSTGDGPAHPA